MPYVKVYATAGRSAAEKQSLMEAVHRGLVEGAGIPEWDKQVRLIEFGPDNMLLPESDDYASYVLVEVTGDPRSLDVKRDLYSSLARCDLVDRAASIRTGHSSIGSDCATRVRRIRAAPCRRGRVRRHVASRWAAILGTRSDAQTV